MDVFTSLVNAHKNAPPRMKLIDIFMVFLVLSGVVQFIFCLLVGNFPFNAFLGGFSATVGQFVLLAALRTQVNPENKEEFRKVSPERAFCDFVFGSLVLHFIVYHFIN
ncbi:Dolichyl-diphosphooligosaccharide--protein glycosyltransferase subunit dad1 [Wickerhamiella sorbophila]|uniref:Dolichyl-diphosphooligosaccharide--protein glycosyltransferase subunit OST2 n=1 Tax=Wickerhamiella sorbophila TaxID=45607 RepID=A0A2T0FIB6_9ASCO|nr:Dolichyl-diphosphooligosaccharide--protein glycosyltransferase subunit dad1 [Wickerhamiella sorbophila]PRT54697.1 Dolichyl-diphosphooligosaccharide--protein glycosyltransferase subunit dad1 [Wickerhamiella sorbophila]